MKYINNFLEHLNEQNDALKELGVKDGKVDLSKTTDKIKDYLFKKGLENNDIEGEEIKIKAKDLEPSQKEIYLDQVMTFLLKNRKFVKKALKGKITDNELVISSDNCIVDGHHKWAGVFILNPDCKIKCVKINIPYKEAIPVFTEILKDFKPENDDNKDLHKYNIFDLIESKRDKVKEAIINIFSHKQGERKFLNKVEQKIDSDLHPINYIINNIYKIPNPENKIYDKSEMPQMSDEEITEILDKNNNI
jgi:hypothetical protein